MATEADRDADADCVKSEPPTPAAVDEALRPRFSARSSSAPEAEALAPPPSHEVCRASNGLASRVTLVLGPGVLATHLSLSGAALAERGAGLAGQICVFASWGAAAGLVLERDVLVSLNKKPLPQGLDGPELQATLRASAAFMRADVVASWWREADVSVLAAQHRALRIEKHGPATGTRWARLPPASGPPEVAGRYALTATAPGAVLLGFVLGDILIGLDYRPLDAGDDDDLGGELLEWLVKSGSVVHVLRFLRSADVEKVLRCAAAAPTAVDVSASAAVVDRGADVAWMRVAQPWDLDVVGYQGEASPLDDASGSDDSSDGASRKAARRRRPGTREPAEGEDHEALLEAQAVQIAMLTRQLEAAGHSAITEIVTLPEAKRRLTVALTALMAGDESATEEFDKWDRYVSLHPDHRKALEEEASAWEAAEKPLLEEAQRRCRTFVPPDVFALGTSVEGLVEAGVPQTVAKRIFQTPAVWLVRAQPQFIARLHVADLRSKYSPNNLDVVELRALYASMPTTFENDARGGKAQYLASLRQRLLELGRGDLESAKKRHGSYFASGRAGVGFEFEEGPFDADAPLVAVTAHRAAQSGAQATEKLATLTDVLRTTAPPATPARGDGPASPPDEGARARPSLVQARRASFMGDGASRRNYTVRRRHSTATTDLAKREAPAARGVDFLADLKRSMVKRRGDAAEPAARPAVDFLAEIKSKFERRRAADAAEPARAPAVDFLAELKRKSENRRVAPTDAAADAASRRPTSSRRPAALVRSDAPLQTTPGAPAPPAADAE
ncbi:hypothetical protein M885DRAFT_128508 [Pelagophyceae sp. CCMP2097]|nr:hypothetical protein M885DRAFT_128508 [Pelagophyceae sp. CCMP2097]